MSELPRHDLQELLRLSENIDLEKQQNRALQFAAGSITLQRFISIIIEELEYAGFKGLELIEKLEMFLRAVIPSYSAKSFTELLNVLQKVDPKFLKTRFYYSLNILREVCTGKGKEFIEIIKASDDRSNYNYGEIIFFTTFLIENVARSLRILRTIKSTRNLSNSEIKQSIEGEYNEHVLKAVMSLSSTTKH